MKNSVVNMHAEKDRPLNSISLQNAVLCADCDVVSDSPHDRCLVCGSHSLLNMARVLGGMMPSRRAAIIENGDGPNSSHKPVLKFPRPRRVFNSRESGKAQADTRQQRLFR